MTQKGWCRTNYHRDGKRRYSFLDNGLCSECSLSLTGKEADKVTRLQETINDLEEERNLLNQEIQVLRQKMQVLIKSIQKSQVETKS